MFKVDIVDKQKPILKLVWSGTVRKEEVESANLELNKAYNEIGKRKFYLIVDVSDLKIFLPDTSEAIIEQQKMFLPKIIQVAEVVGKKATARIQIERTKREAKNEKSNNFSDSMEAEEYLRNL